MEEVKFSSYPEGFKKAAASLEFLPEKDREAFMEAIVYTVIQQ